MAAVASPTTLRQILVTKKPRIPIPRGGAKKNTQNRLWPELELRIWEEFSLNVLNESYGHVLEAPFPNYQLPMPSPDEALAGVTANSDLSIRHLTVWNDQLMRQTLHFAQRHLDICPGLVLRLNASPPDALSSNLTIPNARGPRPVDHLIEIDHQVMAVGIVRTSAKFSGRNVSKWLNRSTREMKWPLRQLASLCRLARTRYGYIQTDDETVVCCFSVPGDQRHVENQDNNNTQEPPLNVAIMPIPWERHGVENLTTDLALWWLSMLAMAGEHHRPIVHDDEMVKIHEWDILHLDDERGWVRRHKYSNWQEPTDPPPPPAYVTPEPGNPAVFHAAVGLHANVGFSPIMEMNEFPNNNNDMYLQVPGVDEFNAIADPANNDFDEDEFYRILGLDGQPQVGIPQ
ncbi:hypothetical protein B0H63DRAFT_462531 [Podospora didyma]|uniref:Uncharacterized protein n=1 Tax=Podospora didyma TaxID=330526 RepID=A0AAE0U8K7_9PEZI|nr:hypothetical protein B0H63DRAFT_462531 [Podospora didyma]